MRKEYFTTFEVAEMCHVSPASVTRWIHDGKLKTSFTAGGHHRIHGVDLMELLKSLNMPVPKELLQAGRTSILIVDDDAQIREFVKMVISRFFEGVEIGEAEDGFAAGAALSNLRPDLVVLDIMLPGLDGYKVCQFIKEAPELKHTKIVAISGLDESDTKAKILSLGADDFLHKPFAIEELKDSLARVSNKLKSHLLAGKERR